MYDVADNNGAIQKIVYVSLVTLGNAYLHLRVEGDIALFPEIEFDFIRSASYTPSEIRNLPAFLSTAICNFHPRRFCATR